MMPTAASNMPLYQAGPMAVHAATRSHLNNSFLNYLLRPEYARTPVNRFCADGLAQSVHSHPQNSLLILLRVATGPTAQNHKGLLLISISRALRIWQLRSQKGTEHLNQVYMLAPTAFRAKVRGAKYREANDPETEIWRACQRSGTASGWG